jgi:hypothetical protein
MDFPRLVFKSPGPFSCNGGTYGHVPVKDDTEYRAALSAGYHPTVPEALKHAWEKPKDVEPESASEVKLGPPPAPRYKTPDKVLRPVVPGARPKAKK